MKTFLMLDTERLYNARWHRFSDFLWLLQIVFLRPKTLHLLLKQELPVESSDSCWHSVFRVARFPPLYQLFLSYLLFGGCFIFLFTFILSTQFFLERVPPHISFFYYLSQSNFEANTSIYAAALFLASFITVLLLWIAVLATSLGSRKIATAISASIVISLSFFYLYLLIVIFVLSAISTDGLDQWSQILILVFGSTFISNLFLSMTINKEGVGCRSALELFLITNIFLIVPWTFWAKDSIYTCFFGIVLSYMFSLQLPSWLLFQLGIWKEYDNKKTPVLWRETSLWPEGFAAERLFRRLKQELDEYSLWWVLSFPIQRWAARKSIILLWKESPGRVAQLLNSLVHLEYWHSSVITYSNQDTEKESLSYFQLLLFELIGANEQLKNHFSEHKYVTNIWPLSWKKGLCDWWYQLLQHSKTLYPPCPPELEKLAQGYL